MEKTLPIDVNLIPQETGWWCGPASTQSVLQASGIRIAEAEIARQIEEFENPGRGDDKDGTDYVGLVEKYLDSVVPEAEYVSVYMPNDPPTQAQRDKLWQDLVHSISNGRGVVMNWVAPPNNRPRGVKGSPDPSYPAGITTFHYVAAVGFDDAGERSVLVADSGFRPWLYWVSFRQCSTLIPPKGYCYSAATPRPEPVPEPQPPVVVPPQRPEQTPVEALVGQRLTGRPWHPDKADDLLGHVLSMRAEGLVTQAIIVALAEANGIDVQRIYQEVRDAL